MRKFRERPETTSALLTVRQAMDRYNLSRYAMNALAKDCGAFIKINERTVRINKSAVDAKLGIADC